MLSARVLQYFHQTNARFSSISFCQNLKTENPIFSNAILFCLSRCMLRSILGIQKPRFDLMAAFLFFQSWPCQNQIQKLATIEAAFHFLIDDERTIMEQYKILKKAVKNHPDDLAVNYVILLKKTNWAARENYMGK